MKKVKRPKTKKGELHPAEAFLKNNPTNSYTLYQLVHMGLGISSTIYCALKRSPNVVRLAHGLYQYTDTPKENAPSVLEYLKSELDKGNFISKRQVLKSFKVTESTFNKAISSLRSEGYYLQRDSVYSLPPSKKR